MDFLVLVRTNRWRIIYDRTYDPKWSDQELVSHIIELNCANSQLTSLPKLLNCQILVCPNNQLISLPELPNCQSLGCSNNRLISLPELPNCQYLNCRNNQLTFENLTDLRKVWKFRNYYYQLKYTKKFHKKIMESKIKRK